MIMKSTSMSPLPLKLAKCTHSPPMKGKLLKNFSIKIWKLERFTLQTPPKHSLFSSWKRKIVGSNHAKTIATSMNIQFKTPILFLSSPTSLINFKVEKYSPNLMCDGSTTMCISKIDTNGKPPSSPIKDSLNQLSCSLDLWTHLPPFNNSWITPFMI